MASVHDQGQAEDLWLGDFFLGVELCMFVSVRQKMGLLSGNCKASFAKFRLSSRRDGVWLNESGMGWSLELKSPEPYGLLVTRLTSVNAPHLETPQCPATTRYIKFL